MIYLYFYSIPFFLLLNTEYLSFPISNYISSIIGLILLIKGKIYLERIFLQISFIWFLVFALIPLFISSTGVDLNPNYSFVFILQPLLNIIIPLLYFKTYKVSIFQIQKIFLVLYLITFSTIVLDAILNYFNTSFLYLIGAKFFYISELITNKRASGFFPEPSNASAGLFIYYCLTNAVPYVTRNYLINLVYKNNIFKVFVLIVSLLLTGSASTIFSIFITIIITAILYHKNLPIKQMFGFVLSPIKILKYIISISISTVLGVFISLYFDFLEPFQGIFLKIFNTLFSLELTTSAFFRLEKISYCIDLIKNQPIENSIFGSGLGYLSNLNVSCINFWGNHFIDTGLIGTLVLITVTLFTLKVIHSNRLKINKKFNYNSIYLTSSIIFLVIQLSFQTSFYLTFYWTPFLLFFILHTNNKISYEK